MAYDQLGMSVGGFLQDLGTSMYRDKRAKAAYAEEMKAREAEDQRKYEMQLKQIEAAELSKAEREAAREQARAGREAERDRRQFEQQRMMEEMRSASRERAATIKANRPLMARDTPTEVYEVNGQLTRVRRDQPIPQGARLPGRGGERQPSDDLTPGQAASVLQTYRKNLGSVGTGDSQRAQTLREAMTDDGLDYDTIVARAQGKKRPLMAQDKPGIMDSIRSAASSFAEKARAMPAPAKPSAPSAGPKPGDVLDGYQYIGGDPADQNSWKKL